MVISDYIHGPDWILPMVSFLLLIIAVILISGHSSGLIAGYNTLSATKKAKYNEKKVCRIVGGGTLIPSILLLVMWIGKNIFPIAIAYVFLGVFIVDGIVLIILRHTIGKK